MNGRNELRPYEMCYNVLMSYPVLSVAGEELLRIASFPLWWYTDGLHELTAWMVQDLRFAWRSLAIRAWMKSLFLPMYGFYDVWSRILSFCVRIVVLCARVLWWNITAFLYLLGATLWCLWLPLTFTLFLV